MDMPVSHQLGMITVDQIIESLETDVGKIIRVADPVSRRVGEKDIKPFVQQVFSLVRYGSSIQFMMLRQS